MQFIMFCSYALALFYGAIRVTQGKMTGGDVLNVMFAALMGSFSLGMVGCCVQIFFCSRKNMQRPALASTNGCERAPVDTIYMTCCHATVLQSPAVNVVYGNNKLCADCVETTGGLETASPSY